MNQHSIRKYFEYLFSEYDFEPISERSFESFGNWVIVLQSRLCRIRFFQDRGEVFMAFSPLWSPSDWQAGPWYDLKVIIAYLAKDAKLPWQKFKLGETEQQLKWLATTFRSYCDQACELFRADNYQLIREELDTIRAQQEEEIQKRMK